MIKFQKVNNTFQAKDWLVSSWNLFKKKPLTWIFMILTFNIFLIVGSSYFIGKFIVALVAPVLAGGIFIALDKENRGEPIAIESIFSAFKERPVLKQLLTVGAIGVAVVTLTMALQYLTGTDYEIMLETSKVEGESDLYRQVAKDSAFTGIVTWVWLCALFFGIPLIAINREDAVPALKYSLLGCLFNFFPLVVFLVMTILLSILLILPFGLGLFVLFPILFGASYFTFKEIYLEAKTELVSELKAGLKTVVESIVEEENKSVVYTNNKAHEEEDLKESYRAINIFILLGIASIAVGVITAAYSYFWPTRKKAFQ